MTYNPLDQTQWPSVVGEQPPFAQMMGARIISVLSDRIEAELIVRAELLNRNGLLHGGAILAVADNLGGTTAFVNIEQSQRTTTVESKTNFLRSIRLGERVRFVGELLHKGRKTMVVQTSVYRGDGKLAAIVTQTQIVVLKDDPSVNGHGSPD